MTLFESINFNNPTNNPEVESSDDTTPSAAWVSTIGDQNDFLETSINTVSGYQGDDVYITDPAHSEGVMQVRYFRHTDTSNDSSTPSQSDESDWLSRMQSEQQD